MAASTTSYSKATDVITFNLVNEKQIRLTKKMFTQFLNIPNSPSFFKPNNDQIMFLFNEMGHQPPLTKISTSRSLDYPVCGISSLAFILGV